MTFKAGAIPWNKGLAGTEICKKNGDGRRGKPSWSKGKKFSMSHRNNLKKSLIDKKLVYQKGNIPWNKGIKRTDIVGYKNGNWKGGATPETVKRLNTPKWDLARRACLKRDKYECQRCHIKNVSLDVHHMVPWRISNDDRLSNLISVCRKCHKYIEGRYKND